MGLHLVALAKLNLITAAHGGASPLLAGLLIWPSVFRLSFNLRTLHQTYTDVLYASRLFFFQMGRIAFSDSTIVPGIDNNNISSMTRWARAIRFAYRRISNAIRLPVGASDEESLRAVSMIAL